MGRETFTNTLAIACHHIENAVRKQRRNFPEYDVQRERRMIWQLQDHGIPSEQRGRQHQLAKEHGIIPRNDHRNYSQWHPAMDDPSALVVDDLRVENMRLSGVPIQDAGGSVQFSFGLDESLAVLSVEQT